MVERLKEVLAAMRKMRARHAKGFERGVKKGGLFLQRKSMEIVPVETGNLRATAFTRTEGSGFNTVVYVGYTAFYAIYVHEDLELRHGNEYNVYHAEEIALGILSDRGPNQQAKFLEQPLRMYRNQIVRTIVVEAQAA